MEKFLSNDVLLLKKNIEKNVIIGINVLFNTIILVIAFYIADNSFQKWVFPFALLSLIQLILNIGTIKKFEGKMFSLTILFLIFSFITHLGMVIIFGFKVDIDLPWNPLSTITTNMFKEASFFALCSHVFLTYGMLIILAKRKKYTSTVLDDNNFENTTSVLHLTKSIGLILFSIGLVPMLYIDSSKAILYINGNYLDTFQIGVPSVVYLIAGFSDIGIMMLLIGNKNNKQKVFIVLIFATIYKGILMFTGGRGEPILFLLTLYFIYFNFIRVNKMKVHQVILNGCLIYIVGYVLTFISQIRMMSINNMDTFIELAKKSFIDFSPFAVIAEFGSTIITLGIAIDFFSSNQDYQYGINYVFALLNAFPNIGGVLDFTTLKTIYVYNFPGNIRTFLGGSYLGEVYYSFGYVGAVFVTFIGMAIGYISVKIEELYERQQLIRLSIVLILFPNILWWTRAYFVDMVREFTWISAFIIILTIVLKRKNRR
ncbi:O-antigen polysaccharide polymerase Wzy [Lysinibacillus sp. KU-BSD001]|uniref:O-antigen polysaccharide polymerase Wzy n=1 Tax=Lysinibacillus sp. KU-BSD001 TaxID=3141328 RepID=UPI0036F11127